MYRRNRKPRKKGAAVFCDAFFNLTVLRILILRQYRLVLLADLLPVEYLEECFDVIRAQVLIF